MRRFTHLFLLAAILAWVPVAAWAQTESGARPSTVAVSAAATVTSSGAGEVASAPTLGPRALPAAADGSGSWAERARSGFGLLVMIGIAWLASVARREVRWRLVLTGVGLQIVLGILTRTPPGQAFFAGFNDAVRALLGYTTEGSAFLFGDFARPGSPAYVAFGVLPTIIFFSTLMAVLYRLGVMQLVVRGIAAVMQRTMGTSGAETLSAAGNIFVGQTEAPLLIRPFIATMTRSELMAVMTGGFATVAGGVMVAYVGMLQNVFPDIAGHLLCASIMSAPAALVVAKILVPETETPETSGTVNVKVPDQDANLIDAAARGAKEGLDLALNVGAMLLAFIALVAMVNGVLGWASGWFGLDEPLSLQAILAWVAAPLAYVMGVSWTDAPAVGSLLGIKTILNEFVAYQELATVAEGLEPRSSVIAAYALCGFANLGSIGIQIGGISSLAEGRRGDLARLALRAVLGGTLAAFMTACVIGVIL